MTDANADFDAPCPPSCPVCGWEVDLHQPHDYAPLTLIGYCVNPDCWAVLYVRGETYTPIAVIGYLSPPPVAASGWRRYPSARRTSR
jgi:hypothetical protein